VELCIDTATRYAGVALAESGVVVAETSWHSRNNHTAELAPAVVQLFRDANTDARQLTGIVTVIGPGGFSALRVGLGFAKGLAESLNIRIAPVSALEVEAARHFDAAAELAPLDFTVVRAAMPLRGESPFGEEFFKLLEEYQAAGSPFHGITPPVDNQ
jgi:tRNA threonylcarbamoyladenosine biosynthesis protein TsaB